MGLSLRQVRRLLAAYSKEGVAALAHGLDNIGEAERRSAVYQTPIRSGQESETPEPR